MNKKLAIYHPDKQHANKLKRAFQKKLQNHEVFLWEECHNANYLITWRPSDEIFKNPNLEIIFGLGAGVDAFVLRKDIDNNIKIVRLEEAGMSNQMLEFALYGILHYSRDMTLFQLARNDRKWLGISTPKLAPFSTKVGVMGLGKLGGNVAKKLSELGYNVSGFSSSEKQINGVDCYCENELNLFLQNSEVLINLLPLTDKTKDILNIRLFEQMPKNSFLINIARGGHLKEEDLTKALNDNLLQGALLDVFKTEPLPKNHPFWRDSRIIITPHLAAITLEKEAINQISNNIVSYESGQQMTGIVNRIKGY